MTTIASNNGFLPDADTEDCMPMRQNTLKNLKRKHHFPLADMPVSEDGVALGQNALNGLAFKAYDPLPKELTALLASQPETISNQFEQQKSKQDLKMSIVYRTSDMDSLFAVALLVDALSATTSVELVAIGESIDYAPLLKKEHLVFVGHNELPASFLEKLQKSQTKLTVFAYESDEPAPVKGGWFKKAQEPVVPYGEYIVPDRSEYFGPLDYMVRNTMVDVVWQWLNQQGRVPASGALLSQRIAVMRCVSLAYPVTNNPTVGLGEGIDSREERSNKAVIYNLIPKITAALASKQPGDALRQVSLNTDVDAYAQHWSDCHMTFARSKVKHVFNITNTMGIGIYSRERAEDPAQKSNALRKKITVGIGMMACSERQHLDMLGIALIHYREFITYEEMHGKRLYRIYAKDRSVRNQIAHTLKSEKVWDDGLCLRAYASL